MTRNEGQKGFTLMEMLIVVAIIGILAAVGLGSYFLSIGKGRDARRKSDLSQIARALEVYSNDHGVYPKSSGDGSIVGCGSAEKVVCGWGDTFTTTVNGSLQTYMMNLPGDPGSDLNYYYLSDGTSYTLCSTLENQNDKDYIDNIEECVSCGSINCHYKLTSAGVVKQ